MARFSPDSVGQTVGMLRMADAYWDKLWLSSYLDHGQAIADGTIEINLDRIASNLIEIESGILNGEDG